MESELKCAQGAEAGFGLNIEGLSLHQSSAMNVLMAGGSVASAALAANVARQTVYQWMKQSLFSKVLNELKCDVANSVRTKLLMSTESAADVVAEAVQRGDVRTALRLLEKTGLLASPPEGPTMQEVQVAERLVCLERNRMRARAEAAVDQTVGAWSPGKYAGKDEYLGLGDVEESALETQPSVVCPERGIDLS